MGFWKFEMFNDGRENPPDWVSSAAQESKVTEMGFRPQWSEWAKEMGFWEDETFDKNDTERLQFARSEARTTR